jgi:hypothetical protein
MNDLVLELMILIGPSWHDTAPRKVNVRCIPGYIRTRKVRGKGGTTVEKHHLMPARFILTIEGVGKLWLYESDIESIVRLGQYTADDEAKGLEARQRRNFAAVLGEDPPADDEEEATP